MSAGEMVFDVRMDSSGFQKSANKLGDIVKGLGVFEVLKKGFQMVGQSIDAAVSRYDTLNKFPKVMEQMGYSTEEANASIKKLSNGIQGLPTTLDGIVANTRQLAIATGSLDKGTDSALALNNAFLASGASSEEASRGLVQYIQMLSSGKVDMQSWRTLNETMTYALQKTAEAFGFTGASAKNDLYAALQSGEITMAQFNDKIIELNDGVNGFAAVAKTATGGIGTAMTNLRTRTVIGVTAIVEALDNGLSQTRFRSIENVINTFSTGFKNALMGVATVVEFVAANIEWLAPIVIGVAAAFAAYNAVVALTNLELSKTAVVSALVAVKNGIMVGVTALQTGSTIAATAAQMGLNAAMYANPIGLVIAAVVALVGALIGLIAWLNKGSDEYQKQKQEVEALAEAQEELTNAQDDSANAHKENVKSIDAESAASKRLSDSLFDLANKENKSASEKRQLAAYVQMLNQQQEGLNLSYDEENDLLSMNADEVNSYIDAKKQMAQSNALIERQNELYAEEAQINEELMLIAEKKNEIDQMYADGRITSTSEYNKLLAELQETEDAYTANLEENGQRQTIVAEQIATTDTTAAETIIANNQALEESAAALAEAEEAEMKRREEALATYTEAATNMFDRISTESEQSVADMIANLKHNQEAVADWSNNLVLLAEKGVDQGLLQQLRDAGPESAATVAAMVNATDEELAELSTVFANGADVATQALATELGLPEVTNAGSEMVDDLAAGVSSNEAMADATTQMIQNARTALETTVATSDFSSIGMTIAADIVSGVSTADMSGISAGLSRAMQAGATSVNNAVKSMVTQVQAQLKQMSSTSVSTVTQMMTAFVSGIQTKQGAAKSAAQGVATGVVTEFESMKNKAKTVVETMMTSVVTAIKNGTEAAKSAASGVVDAIISAINAKNTAAYNAGKEIGAQMANGMVAGLDANKSSVYAKADEIAAEAARRIKAALQVKSPSRVMEDIFQYVVLGMISGMEDEEMSLYKAVDALAEGVIRRFNIIPESMAAALNQKLRLAIVTNQTALASVPAVATAATAPAGTVNNFYMNQTINSDRYMSPADNSREAEAMLRRAAWQIK